MSMYTVENIKSWITPQGVLYGLNVAYLMGMDHMVFHDRLYKFYHNPNSNSPQSEPLMYWRDPDSGEMVHMNAEFPDSMNLTLKNYGAPTYGIESKHLDDLYCVFAENREMIDIIKQAFDLSNRKE